jgi:hypothetical protein
MRVSELLNEKLVNDKQVVGLKDVDAVIAVMGQPEDYIIEDEKGAHHNATANTRTKNYTAIKKRGMIGGVASGLGHYFGLDAVWIRIALILLVLLDLELEF